MAAFHFLISPVIRGSALGSDPDVCGGSFHGRGFPRFFCDLPFVGPFWSREHHCEGQDITMSFWPLFFLLIIFYWISNNCDCVACVYVCGHGHACICVNSGFCSPGILFMFCYFCIWSYLLLVLTNVCVYFLLPCRPGLLVLVCWQSVQSLGAVCAFIWSSTGLAVWVCTDASVHHSKCVLLSWTVVTAVLDGRCCYESLVLCQEHKKVTSYTRRELRQRPIACCTALSSVLHLWRHWTVGAQVNVHQEGFM